MCILWFDLKCFDLKGYENPLEPVPKPCHAFNSRMVSEHSSRMERQLPSGIWRVEDAHRLENFSIASHAQPTDSN
jgi:hypothetical protein